MTHENYWIRQEGNAWLVFQNGLRLTTEFETRAAAEQYIHELKAYDWQADRGYDRDDLGERPDPELRKYSEADRDERESELQSAAFRRAAMKLRQQSQPPVTKVFGKLRAWYAQQIEASNRRMSAGDPESLARQRSVRTATLVTIATVIWGGLALALIEPLKYALLSAALIFFAALTVRMFEKD